MQLIDLPDDIFRTIFVDWIEGKDELVRVDKAFCNRHQRLRYLSWPKQPIQHISSDHDDSMKGILRWASSRHVPIKFMTLYVDGVTIPKNSFGAELEGFIFENGVAECGEGGYENADLKFSLFPFLARFPTLRSIGIGSDLNVQIKCSVPNGSEQTTTNLRFLSLPTSYGENNYDDEVSDEESLTRKMLSLCPNLTHLQVGDISLSQLSQWLQNPSNLQDLRLIYPKCPLASIQLFHSFTQLHTLALSGSTITHTIWKELVATLPHPQQLVELRLVHHRLTPKGLKIIPRKFPSLQRLVLGIPIGYCKAWLQILQSIATLNWCAQITCYQLNFGDNEYDDVDDDDDDDNVTSFDVVEEEQDKEEEGGDDGVVLEEEWEDPSDIEYEEIFIPMLELFPTVTNLRLVFPDVPYVNFALPALIRYLWEEYPYASTLRHFALRTHTDSKALLRETYSTPWRFTQLRSLDLYGIWFQDTSIVDTIFEASDYCKRYYLPVEGSDPKDTMYTSYCDYRVEACLAEDDMGRMIEL